MSSKAKLAIGGAMACLGLAAVWFYNQNDAEPRLELRELARGELELRDDVLYVRGEGEPFNGKAVEYYPDMERRIALEIRDGKPDGVSRGWYDNGQLEVEETFVAGLSNGLRTRWHENGMKKSQAEIIDGKIEGVFTRWYDNGKKEAEAEMKDGKPHGVSQAWYRSGKSKSRAVLEAGEVVRREFFEEGKAL